jgi:uncharacterized protein YaeQ
MRADGFIIRAHSMIRADGFSSAQKRFNNSGAILVATHSHDRREHMALKATIFKADLQIADMDRNYYHDHALTIARHPSETDERMMVRLLAYALHADEALSFGKGLSADDEPDLWQKDLTGAIELWIDVGQPDDKRLRRACGRARDVFVYSYGGHGAAIWWDQICGKLDRTGNLTVVSVPAAASQALAKLARRNMRLNCTVQDQQVWLADTEERVQVDLIKVKVPPARQR